ncbi:MAG TPA: YciI family protein [Methyloceanibacter sp.]|nr:YciI family protein [Methyloceanibacter sp.]
MTGSLIVVDAPSLEAAQQIADEDPFAKVGLFAKVDIRPWLWTMKNTRKDS